MSPAEDEKPPEGAAVGAPQRGPGPLEADRWSQPLRSLPFWQMSLSYMVCGSTTFLLSVHFVPYAIDRGVAPNLAATIFAVMLGLNVFGALGAGLLALVYVLRGFGYMILLLPGLLGITWLSGNLGLWTFAVVGGFSWWATLPLTSSLTADVYGLRSLGTITGVSFVFKDPIRRYLKLELLCVISQSRRLALDRVVLLLAVGRDSRIDRSCRHSVLLPGLPRDVLGQEQHRPG